MALIQCPECQASASSTATACPQCGYGIAAWRTREQQAKAAQYRANQRRQNQKLLGVVGLACVVMVDMCSGLASMADKKQVAAAQQAEQVAVVQAKAAGDQQAKDFVAKVPELWKQIDEMTTAILAEDFQKADALDAQVVIALNRIDRVPNLLERDKLRMHQQTADAPSVA